MQTRPPELRRDRGKGQKWNKTNTLRNINALLNVKWILVKISFKSFDHVKSSRTKWEWVNLIKLTCSNSFSSLFLSLNSCQLNPSERCVTHVVIKIEVLLRKTKGAYFDDCACVTQDCVWMIRLIQSCRGSGLYLIAIMCKPTLASLRPNDAHYVRVSMSL